MSQTLNIEFADSAKSGFCRYVFGPLFQMEYEDYCVFKTDKCQFGPLFQMEYEDYCVFKTDKCQFGPLFQMEYEDYCVFKTDKCQLDLCFKWNMKIIACSRRISVS